MRKIIQVLFSMYLMATVLIVFAASIAVATFIENTHGTDMARTMVYNATWFEILLFIGAINLTGNIFIRRLYRKEKLTLFLFHLSFVIILLGAAVTRYFSSEGTMMIREGKSANFYLSAAHYLKARVDLPDGTHEAEKSAFLTEKSVENLELKLKKNGFKAKLECLDFIPSPSREIQPVPGEKPIVHLVLPGKNGRENVFLSPGELYNNNDVEIGFENHDALFNILLENDSIYFRGSDQIRILNKNTWTQDTLLNDTIYHMKKKTLHYVGNTIVALKDFQTSGKIIIKQHPPTIEDEELNSYALKLKLSSGTGSKDFHVFGRKNTVPSPTPVVINDTRFEISFGPVVRPVPFTVKLNDFILERYPGSDSPSSFESHVTLIDKDRNIEKPVKIYMNNVLNYRGYKLYQTSYDKDEKGTYLWVNKDKPGTFITYIGYILLTLGIFASIFNKNSLFKHLFTKKYKLPVLLILIGTSFFTGLQAQDTASSSKMPIVDARHAERFGQLLMQDHQGRVKPMNTMNSELLRKIYRGDEYKGLSPDQVFLGILTEKAFWQKQPIIRISHPRLQEMFKTGEKHISFEELFRANQDYLLIDHVEEANRKKPASRSKFENKLLQVDERANILNMAFTGYFLKVFPKPGDPDNKWYSPVEPLEGFAPEDSTFVRNIPLLYMESVKKGIETGDWNDADKYLEAISLYQQKFGSEIMPSQTKVKVEMLYNKLNVFDRVGNYYLLFGLLFLLWHFIVLLKPRMSKKWLDKTGVITIMVLFLAHAITLGTRWYLSGYAPWSNGYEALIYISWTVVLAGLFFSRKSIVTVYITAVLASLILHVAHLSWMDPQITNLVPVLKSYWLVIHVAVITTSYGFLGLGFLLGIFNIIIMNFYAKNNYGHLSLQVKKTSDIIMMTLIIGLYLLVIGTFLGGVWANESWGRYWAWDAKETWALVTILVYAFIVHTKMIPGLKGEYFFNVLAIFGYSSVIFTYFGVNYYLSGLHSYAAGDPRPLPPVVIYIIIGLATIVLSAWVNKKRVEKMASKTSG